METVEVFGFVSALLYDVLCYTVPLIEIYVTSLFLSPGVLI